MEIFHEISTYRLVGNFRNWSMGKRKLHWHEKIEIIQCIEGSLTALVDGTEYNVKKGDILVIGESVVHTFDFSIENTKTFLIQFPFNILLNFRVIPKPIKPLITAEEIENTGNLKKQIDALFDVVAQEDNVINEEANPFMEGICASIYYKLMKHFPYEEPEKALNKDKQDFYKIVKYVNEHFTEDITVKSISEHFYIDRGKISKTFIKYSGTTLNEYINNLRMNKALELIENGVKVTEAAFESGFQTVRTFNNIRNKMALKKENEEIL